MSKYIYERLKLSKTWPLLQGIRSKHPMFCIKSLQGLLLPHGLVFQSLWCPAMASCCPAAPGHTSVFRALSLCQTCPSCNFNSYFFLDAGLPQLIAMMGHFFLPCGLKMRLSSAPPSLPRCGSAVCLLTMRGCLYSEESVCPVRPGLQQSGRCSLSRPRAVCPSQEGRSWSETPPTLPAVWPQSSYRTSL